MIRAPAPPISGREPAHPFSTLPSHQQPVQVIPKADVRGGASPTALVIRTRPGQRPVLTQSGRN